LTPDRRQINEVGLEPDVLVEEDPEGAYQDAILHRGLELLGVEWADADTEAEPEVLP
jgi:C-terminal processing protease CtpA/Prc